MRKTALFSLAILLLFSGCTPQKTPISSDGKLRYASQLCMEHHENYTLVSIRNPWDTTQVLHTYILVPDTVDWEQKKGGLQPGTLSASTLIRTPLRHIGISSTAHCGLLDELGCKEAVVGVCDKQYMKFEWVEEGIHKGIIKDFGNSMNPDIEQMMLTMPDAILLTPFEHNSGYAQIEQLGIPVIACAEYMETSPLGEAEWMRFYAALMGVEERGDSLFAAVEEAYLTMKAEAAEDTMKPKVLTEMMVGTTWFVPGGKSTMAQMIADAGGEYVFAEETPTRQEKYQDTGSRSLSFEQVLVQAQDADVWLIKYNQSAPLTYTTLFANYSPYAQFKAFQEHHLWGCNLDTSRFYDETPFHPERVLSDFIGIFHPSHAVSSPSSQVHYFSPLQ